MRPLPTEPPAMTAFRLPLSLMLALAAATASAEWLPLHEDEAVVYYVDPASRQALRRPRVRVLRDFRSPTAAGDRSARLLYEADCDARRLRLSNGIYLKRPMGEGEVSGMINSGGWLDPDTREVLGKIYRVLCDAPAGSAD